MYRIKSIEGNQEMFYFNLFQKSELTFFRTQFFQSHILKIFIMIILLSFNLNFMHAFIKMVKKLLIYQIKIREDVECFFFYATLAMLRDTLYVGAITFRHTTGFKGS